MKKAIIVSVIAGFSVIGLSTGVANAWRYGVTGKGVCLPNGSYQITWTVDNTSEPTALEINESSNVSVVPLDATVDAKKTKNFTQIADGTKPGIFSLSLKADWNGDRSNQSQYATVKLKTACAQPVVTPTEPEGGRGGGEVLSESTQVVIAPVGAVNAGEGNSSINFAAVAGMLASVAALVLRVLRIAKHRA